LPILFEFVKLFTMSNQEDTANKEPKKFVFSTGNKIKLSPEGDASVSSGAFSGQIYAQKIYSRPANENTGGNKGVFAFENLNKKERFEQFLTYRKRLSRLALTQCCYLYEMEFLTSENNFNDDSTTLHIDKTINTDDVVRSVIFLYRNVFFYGRYGLINKKKKLEEKWIADCFADIVKYINELDDIIRQHLSSKWTIYKLDPIVRAVLRSALYEMKYTPTLTKKLIVSEYVKLTTAFYEDPKVFGFINGILDSISKDI